MPVDAPPLKTLNNQVLALYQWTAKHELVLIEAARRVFKHVLFDHIRARDPDDVPHAAIRWINSIVKQMEVDGFEACGDPMKMPPKPKRGRPKKRDAAKNH